MAIERVTVTMPADMVDIVKRAIAAGHYASTSEVVREALRDWSAKRAAQQGEFEALRQEIAKGLADLQAGRVHDFDVNEVIKRGRKLLNTNSA